MRVSGMKIMTLIEDLFQGQPLGRGRGRGPAAVGRLEAILEARVEVALGGEPAQVRGRRLLAAIDDDLPIAVQGQRLANYRRTTIQPGRQTHDGAGRRSVQPGLQRLLCRRTGGGKQGDQNQLER